ncbi:MAG: hypothetical protein RL660_165 [Bacteroidota bacterium]
MNLNLKVALALLFSFLFINNAQCQFFASCGNKYLDKTFKGVGYDTTITNVPHRIMTTSGGRYVLAGTNFLARYFSSGALDLSFGNNGYAAVSGMGSIADAMQLSTGHYVLIDNDQVWFYDSSGNLATSMASSGVLTLPPAVNINGLPDILNAKEVLEHPSGGIVILTSKGKFMTELQSGTDTFRHAVVKTNSAGILDSTFGTNGISIINSSKFNLDLKVCTFTTVPTEQRIYVAAGYGGITGYPPVYPTQIRRLFYDGTIDTSSVITINATLGPHCLRYSSGHFIMSGEISMPTDGPTSFALIVDSNSNYLFSNGNLPASQVVQNCQLYDLTGLGVVGVSTSFNSGMTTLTDSMVIYPGFFGTSAFYHSTDTGTLMSGTCGTYFKIADVAQDSISKDIYFIGALNSWPISKPCVARIGGQCFTSNYTIAGGVISVSAAASLTNNSYCDNMVIDSVLGEPVNLQSTSCSVRYQWFWSRTNAGPFAEVTGGTSQHLTNFSLQSVIPAGQSSSDLFFYRKVWLDSCVCSDSAVSNTLQYTVHKSTTASAPAGAAFCFGAGNFELIGGSASSSTLGNWYFGGTLLSATDTCIATSPGTYIFVESPSSGYATCDTALISLPDGTPNNIVTSSGNTLTAVQNNATYQWASCDNNGNLTNISGATAQSYTPSAAGSYAVKVTLGDCNAYSVCTQFWLLGVNINSQMGALKIVPNPATGKATLIVPTQAIGTSFTIINATGQVVHAGVLRSTKHDVDVTIWAAGIYVVRCQQSNYYLIVEH